MPDHWHKQRCTSLYDDIWLAVLNAEVAETYNCNKVQAEMNKKEYEYIWDKQYFVSLVFDRKNDPKNITRYSSVYVSNIELLYGVIF